MNKLILIIVTIFFIACQNSEKSNPAVPGKGHGRKEQYRRRTRGNQEETKSNTVPTSGDTVFVRPGTALRKKLVTYEVSSREHLVELTTTGVVRPLSGHKAEITTPFEGRIVKSFVKLGQKVKTGTPLFEISSSDYLETVRMFLQAGRERELAEKNYMRKKDLLDMAISSKKEFDEARLEFDLADKEYEKTAAMLRIFNINPGDADITQPLIVRSPIPGEVVHTDITVGQYIKSDSDPIVIIADLDKIWVVASVREKDLGAVSLRDQVEIVTESMPDKSVKGFVDYIGNIMNEQTRSVEVYTECENPGLVLKCGMFVTVRFYHKLDNALIIPASSVLQDNDKCFLFLQKGPDLFVKRKVTVTSIPGNKMIIHSGVDAGNIIVSEGGIYLQ
jgi:cobalt-zinc-cadmium efflux system membrane fusion protein